MTDNFSIGREISAAWQAVKGWLALAFADAADEPGEERASPRLTDVFNAVTGKTIDTPRLELRPLHVHDAEAIANFLNRDDGAFQTWYYDRPLDEEMQPYSVTEVRESMLDYLQRNPTFLHPVYERRTDRMIGVMGWWEDDFGRPRLTYFVSPSERQHGYAFEAYMAELKEFAQHGAATELIAQVAPENHASQNLLLKAGFHDAGTMVGDSGVLRGEAVILFRRDLSDLAPPAGPSIH